MICWQGPSSSDLGVLQPADHIWPFDCPCPARGEGGESGAGVAREQQAAALHNSGVSLVAPWEY